MTVADTGKTVNCVLLIVIQSLFITETQISLTTETVIEIISQL